VVILSTYDYEEYILEGIKAGAMGYVLKDTTAGELVRTIRRVHRGERFIQSAVAGKILFELANPGPQAAPGGNNSIYGALTDREVDIITRLAKGMSNKEVAADLTLSEGTIKNYVSGILSKLQVNNRVQAINVARQRKLI
jgi:DNA-binding NarL/FixJ family response regulator